MRDQKALEKETQAILARKHLDWIVAFVDENKADGAWEIELEVPDGPELILSVPPGSKHDMKLSLEKQVDEELQRLKLQEDQLHEHAAAST